MFPFNKPKPAAKVNPATEFVTSLDAAVSAARRSRVDARYIVKRLEATAEGLRFSIVNTIGLHESVEW
jgi:hypothetical protein